MFKFLEGRCEKNKIITICNNAYTNARVVTTKEDRLHNMLIIGPDTLERNKQISLYLINQDLKQNNNFIILTTDQDFADVILKLAKSNDKKIKYLLIDNDFKEEDLVENINIYKDLNNNQAVLICLKNENALIKEHIINELHLNAFYKKRNSIHEALFMYIDDVQKFVSKKLVDILTKGSSNNIGCILNLVSLKLIEGELLETITSNCLVTLINSGCDEYTAKIYADKINFEDKEIINFKDIIYRPFGEFVYFFKPSNESLKEMGIGRMLSIK